MLRSTHQPQRPLGGVPSLPLGWTAHIAPTGHPYYYNTDTKQSTYIHPSTSSPRPESHAQPHLPSYQEPISSWGFLDHGGAQDSTFPIPSFQTGSNNFLGPEPAGRGAGFDPIHQGFNGPGNHPTDRRDGRGQQGRWQNRQAQDRPKSKHVLQGHEPWLLVRTKLGRRFLHNLDSGESFWKIPQDLVRVIEAVEEQQKLQRQPPTAETTITQDEEHNEVHPSAAEDPPTVEQPSGRIETGLADNDEPRPESGSDEYEEVEVTDDDDDENAPKRQRMDEAQSGQPREFNEDDIAFQLAAMGQDYGLEPGEYADGAEENWEEGAEGLPLTDEESTGLFRDLLDDYCLNPFSTWEKIVQDGKIVEDERYTALHNMKSRKEVWAEWCREKIQISKEQREKAEKKNPSIPYLAYLQENASPRLYWQEFKRKHRAAPELRDPKLSDKQREKLYRDYIARLKLPESTLKSDFSIMLKSQPLTVLNHSTGLSLLPSEILTDIRYISLDPKKRNALLEAYTSTLGPPPADTTALSADEQNVSTNRERERERRQRALAEREERIAAEKIRQSQALRVGRERLREEEAEIARAMKVGKDGLRAQLITASSAKDGTTESAGNATGQKVS